MNATLTFPFIDVDRMTPPRSGDGKISARVWFVVAYLIVFAGWMIWRWGL